MKLLVLGGGNSPEREVSLRSAKYIATAAEEAGFEVVQKDPAGGIDFLDDINASTIILPILHGAGGEDGSLQAELEKRNLAYLGSSSKTSVACWDKWNALQNLAKNKIPIAEGELVTPLTFRQHPLAKKPYVLKVRRGGSSIGVLIVRDIAKVQEWQIESVFAMESPAILEELVEGIEITVAVLDDKALPVVEIQPPEGAEFDYENKYNGATAELCPPQNVPAEIQEKAQRLAEKTHKVMGCRHLSRIDMMIRADGSLAVFDINTIPGLTDQSLYPKAAGAAGMSMLELTRRFVELVKRDYNL